MDASKTKKEAPKNIWFRYVHKFPFLKTDMLIPRSGAGVKNCFGQAI
jgi:hypothetical protein